MAVRIKDTTRVELCNIPVPASTTSNRGYTAISHKSIMDFASAELEKAGFNIQSESYRCTGDGNIAQGIYHLTYNNDPEIGMMFAWSNSYNKQMRFKCGIGGYVMVCMNGMLTGDMGSWSRKHTGTADEDTENTILDQITNAHKYYNQLITDKNKMKEIIVTTKEQAALLGVLFAEYEILTTEQMSIVKEQMNKPSFAYNAHRNSLWAFYNHVTLSLKKSHPRTWMDDQRKLHMFIGLEYDLYNFDPSTVEDTIVEDAVIEDPLLKDPAQTNILAQIEEAEANSFNSTFYTGPNKETIIAITPEDDLSYGPVPDVAEIEEPPCLSYTGTIAEEHSEIKAVDVLKSLADTMVAPLKSDDPLPLSTLSDDLPQKEEEEFDWKINGGKPSITMGEEITGVTAEMIEDARPKIYIESDDEYYQRVASIEGEPEEVNATEEADNIQSRLGAINFEEDVVYDRSTSDVTEIEGPTIFEMESETAESAIVYPKAIQDNIIEDDELEFSFSESDDDDDEPLDFDL